MALLMTMIMVGGVLTGCGSEKKVIESKADGDVVVEESDIDENVSEENNTNIEESNVADEETIEEFTFTDLWNAASDCSENGNLSFNPAGQITIFNVKLPASEEFVDMETFFDMYVVNATLSEDNLQKGRYYDEYHAQHPEKDEYKYVMGIARFWKSELDFNNTFIADEYSKIEPDPNQPVYTLNAHYIDDNNDGIADKIALAYDAEEETNIIGYISTNISTKNSTLVGAGDRAWAFETPVSENGEDFVYYTVIEVPKSVSEDTVNFVIGSPDDMKSKTNINVVE